MKPLIVLPTFCACLTYLSCRGPAYDPTAQAALYPCFQEIDSTIRCGKFAVFENRNTKCGRKIELHVIVIPSTNQQSQKPPLFYFDGGPGVAASNSAEFFADTTYGYRKEHDIVLVDVRGTGRSHPLHCRQLQYTDRLEQHFDEMYPEQAVRSCYDSLSKIADLSQYTTTNIATDIEEVRKWLGYGKIHLFGLSYGTRLAQVYMKMYPASVESCVLWSPTIIDARMPLYHARFADDCFEKLFVDCEQDSLCAANFPNFRGEFAELIARGKRKPFGYMRTGSDGRKTQLAIPWYALHTKLRSLAYVPFGLRQIPFIVHQAYAGNWEPFISLFPDEPVFDDFIADGLYLCITCAEDVPFIIEQAVDSMTRGTSMGDYRIRQQQNACRHWVQGEVPDDFAEPLTSDHPVLIFTGTFDPVTPPSWARQIHSRLPGSYLIEIPEMSHLFDGLSNSECFDNIVLAFLKDPRTRPDSDCIASMQPEPFRIK